MRKLRQQTSGSKNDILLFERCVKSIRELDPTAEIVLYGSRARGEATEESDLVAFEKSEVAPWLDEAKDFVESIDELLS